MNKKLRSRAAACRRIVVWDPGYRAPVVYSMSSRSFCWRRSGTLRRNNDGKMMPRRFRRRILVIDRLFNGYFGHVGLHSFSAIPARLVSSPHAHNDQK